MPILGTVEQKWVLGEQVVPIEKRVMAIEGQPPRTYDLLPLQPTADMRWLLKALGAPEMWWAHHCDVVPLMKEIEEGVLRARTASASEWSRRGLRKLIAFIVVRGREVGVRLAVGRRAMVLKANKPQEDLQWFMEEFALDFRTLVREDPSLQRLESSCSSEGDEGDYNPADPRQEIEAETVLELIRRHKRCGKALYDAAAGLVKVTPLMAEEETFHFAAPPLECKRRGLGGSASGSSERPARRTWDELLGKATAFLDQCR